MVKGELRFYQKRHLTEKGGEGGIDFIRRAPHGTPLYFMS